MICDGPNALRPSGRCDCRRCGVCLTALLRRASTHQPTLPPLHVCVCQEEESEDEDEDDFSDSDEEEVERRRQEKIDARAAKVAAKVAAKEAEARRREETRLAKLGARAARAATARFNGGYCYAELGAGDVPNTRDFDYEGKSFERSIKRSYTTPLPATDEDIDPTRNYTEIRAGSIQEHEHAFDIGSNSRERIVEWVGRAQTVLLYGPLGAVECNEFQGGTREVMDAMAEATGQGKLTMIGTLDMRQAGEAVLLGYAMHFQPEAV